jgi:hypothetical protein
VRVGLDTYHLTYAASTITTDEQEVVCSYTPGNITAGTGNPLTPATTFSNVTATNNLSPVVTPVISQTAFGFRPFIGTMTDAPFYKDASSVSENAPARFIAGAKFRVHMKLACNTADAPSQAFFVCWDHQESGSFVLLSDTCTTNTPCFTDAPSIGDGAPTPELLTPTESTFVSGASLETASTTVPVTLTTNSETGYEAVIQLPTNATIGHKYRFRMCKSGGGALDSYLQTPLVTVISKRSSQSGGTTR